jgi:Rrf2 family protein
MVRLSKRVEYGLIALRHFATKQRGELVTAKEIAEVYGIPYEMLAKILQKLTRAGLITSFQGVHGGYGLARGAEQMHISEIISAIEGAQPVIAQCMAESPVECGVFNTCTIKSPLTKVQANIELAFSTMTLSEIV